MVFGVVYLVLMAVCGSAAFPVATTDAGDPPLFTRGIVLAAKA
jgi:hypothetical protein